MRVPADAKKGAPNSHARLCWCDACAYGSVQPIPGAHEIAHFYALDHYYTQGASHFARGVAPSLLDRVRVHLAWRLDRGTPTNATLIHAALAGRASSICDIGCGGGELLCALRDLGHRTIGVELDHHALSLRGTHALEVYAGAAEELPAEVTRQRFDCVLMSHGLEHCRHPLRALCGARDLLAPGGKLVCEVPNNAAAALTNAGCAWEMFDVPRHLHFFTPRSLKRACEAAGLRILSMHYGHYARQFKNDWIATEGRLWDNLMQVDQPVVPMPHRNSRLRAWKLLLETLAAPSSRKYDSVGFIAVRA